MTEQCHRLLAMAKTDFQLRAMPSEAEDKLTLSPNLKFNSQDC